MLIVALMTLGIYGAYEIHSKQAQFHGKEIGDNILRSIQPQ